MLGEAKAKEDSQSILEGSEIKQEAEGKKALVDSTVTVDLHKESLANKTHPTLLQATDESVIAPTAVKKDDVKKPGEPSLKNGKHVVTSEADAEAGRARAAAREKLMAEILTEAEKKGEKLSKTELKRR